MPGKADRDALHDGNREDSVWEEIINESIYFKVGCGGFGKIILHVKRGFFCINMTKGIYEHYSGFTCEPLNDERGIRLKTH